MVRYLFYTIGDLTYQSPRSKYLILYVHTIPVSLLVGSLKFSDALYWLMWRVLLRNHVLFSLCWRSKLGAVINLNLV